MKDKNHWSEFEYSKLKLLLNKKKVNSILDVLNGKKEFDEEPPISVELHLTDICNLKCPWCTDSKLKENNATKFKADDFLKDIFDTYELNPEKYFTATTNEFIKDEVNSEKAKMKITKKIQEWVLTDDQINQNKTPAEIFAGNAKQEQIANESAEAKEWTEDLPSTPWIDETTVSPLNEIY